MTLFRLETQANEVTAASGLRITAFRRALRLRLPGLNREFVWARPLAVLLQPPGEAEILIPAPDTLQPAQGLALLMIVLLGVAMLSWLILRRRQPGSRRPNKRPGG